MKDSEDKNQQKDISSEKLLEITRDIICAYLQAGGKITVRDCQSEKDVFSGDILRGIYDCFNEIMAGKKQTYSPLQKPFVPIHKSISPDTVCCLECGRKMKMLRRHLMCAHALSEEAYKEKWKLPAVYPLVASNYSKIRKDIALKTKLGTHSKSKRGRGN